MLPLYRVMHKSKFGSNSQFIMMGLISTFMSILVILTLQLIAVNARTVSENSLQDSQQHNHLVSNRHELAPSGSGKGNGNNKMIQSASSFTGNPNRCQQGWVWSKNKCLVTTQSRRNFAHAIELCRRMYNATLPTIHNEDENEFLRNNIELQNSPIWLYARHNHQYNMTRWLDKSQVDYVHWDAGQPSDKSSLICIQTGDTWYMKKAEPADGQTECVSFWEDAKWGTQVGCSVLLPVVCEKRLTPVSRMTDGSNGSISSQFELQQMAPVSGGQNSLTIQLGVLFYSTLFTIATAINSIKSATH